MHFAFRAQAFGPLNRVDWAVPPGVSVIVGPNRVGKSTLLALPEFIRMSIADGLNEAVKQLFGGITYFRNLNAAPETAPQTGFSVGPLAWDIDIALTGVSIAPYSAERLSADDQVVLSRAFGAAEGIGLGESVALGPNVLPAICAERGSALVDRMREKLARGLLPILSAEELEQLKKTTAPLNPRLAMIGGMLSGFSQSFRSYRTYQYRISHLLKYGSTHSAETVLDRNGDNVFPLLRNWRDDSETEERFTFVIDTLRAAFPHVRKVDFEQAGETVIMAIRDRRWPDKKVPISRESTGLMTALLQLCAVASGEKSGLVTIDELETSLHPHAIRVLVAAFRRWAAEHDLRVVLATQSETVLDQFHDDPGQIYVIEPKQDTSPRSLTEMFSPEYLAQFSLGDLFSHLEFGSNGELDPE